MARASRTIVIDRPVEEVFAFFTTHANDAAWRSQVVEISESEPPRQGARIHQVLKGPGGQKIPADLEVTTYEPPLRYTFDVVTGPVRPHGEWLFAPAGDATEVTFTLSAELKGLKNLAFSRPAQSAMDSEVAGLDTAKQLLENS
ncbi:hypothetical protein GCM10027517_20840 [Phycicoccus ginsengisoli]